LAERRQTEVLVIGAGPVGLFAANCLADRGLDVVVVDTYSRSALHSHALALHPESLGLLDELGLAVDLVRLGRRLDQIGVYRDDRRVGEIDLRRPDRRFPFLLVLPQALLEAALERRLEARGVRVRWGHQALAFDPHADGVTTLVAQVGAAAARRQSISSRFVIGADGSASVTRALLGLAFPDYGPRETFRLLEFETDAGLPDEARIVFSDSTTNVLWPITAVRGRWSLQLTQEEGDDPVSVKALLERRAPWFSAPHIQEIWNTEVTFEPRLVEHVGVGPVWLAGDAAHVIGPVGVQNMNVSLREVADLANRLAAGKRSDIERLLDSYDAERQVEWRKLLGMDRRLEVRPGAPDWARELAPRLPACLPATGRELNDLLGQVGLSSNDGPATG